MYSRNRSQLLAQQGSTLTGRPAPSSPKALRLSVSYITIERMLLDPRNPRKHTKQQIEQIKTSIEVHGFLFPIVADRNCKIIAGHGRYVAVTGPH